MRLAQKLLYAMTAASLLLAAACRSADSECARTLRGVQSSPDGKFKAAILDVNCRATTGLASWVLIGAADAAFKNDADRAAVFQGSVKRVVWQRTDLVVIYDRAKPVATPAAAKGVAIVYLEAEPAVDLGALH